MGQQVGEYPSEVCKVLVTTWTVQLLIEGTCYEA